MGLWDGLYRLLMRRNSVYVTFVVAGAFVGERVVDYGVHKLWDYNNVGDLLYLWPYLLLLLLLSRVDHSQFKKKYEDIPVLGQRPSE